MTPQSSESIEDLPLSELRRFVATLASEVGRLGTLLEAKDAQIEALKTEVQELKDEVARLKGLPPRPKFKAKPSGMEKATSPGPGGKGRSKRRRGSKRDQLEVTAEVVLRASPPAGSRFLGYEDILVQDLKIQVVTVLYRKERWAGPSGERIVAALPAGILGGYGPELRRFIAAGHFQGQMTAERLTALLGGMGMAISKRQVVRLLSRGLEGLIAEDQAVLRAALETAAWITVDDTGHRHAGKDGVVRGLPQRRVQVAPSVPGLAAGGPRGLRRRRQRPAIYARAELGRTGHRRPWRPIATRSSPMQTPGRPICWPWARPGCRSRPIRSRSPPKGRCGGRSRPTA